MARIRISSDAINSAGRAAHDAGLGALLGGNLYGRIAMHPALAGIGEKSERGKVVNRAWQRYGWVNSAALLAIVGGWAGARVNGARPGQGRGCRRRRRDRRCDGAHRDSVRAQRAGRRRAARGWEHACARESGRRRAPQATPECTGYRERRGSAVARGRERGARAGKPPPPTGAATAAQALLSTPPATSRRAGAPASAGQAVGTRSTPLAAP